MEASKKNGVLKTLSAATRKGSAATRLSLFVMGGGQLLRRQYVKGALFCLAQVIFTLYLSLFGGRYLLQLFSGNLGTKLSGEVWNEELQMFEKIRGDNSFLILLYGVMTLVVACVYFVLWYSNVKGSLENDQRVDCGERLSTFREDIQKLFNERFYP